MAKGDCKRRTVRFAKRGAKFLGPILGALVPQAVSFLEVAADLLPQAFGPFTDAVIRSAIKQAVDNADLVMPRMRAVAGAYFISVNTFIGLALGPYTMGQLSDLFASDGMNPADSLRLAIACALLIFVITLIFLTLAWRHLGKDEASRLDRARQLGEEVTETA